jgi:hypothetical protein
MWWRGVSKDNEDVMSFGVFSWWLVLCAVATLNIATWSLVAATLKRRQTLMSVDSYAACRVQLLLSAVYVFGCAFRSVLPVYDVPRLGLFDTWLSSVIVGRSVATIAELSFVAQWALILRETARATGSVVARATSLAIVPLIAIAEGCSWYAVLTTANIGHVAENSLWGLSAALAVASMAAILPRCSANRRPVLIAWCVAGAAYVAYIFLIDVPMYWSRWLADQAGGHRYLSIAQGVLDVSEHRVVSYRWEDWKSEIVWMSLYFSVAVWISISLIQAPVKSANA